MLEYPMIPPQVAAKDDAGRRKFDPAGTCAKDGCRQLKIVKMATCGQDGLQDE